MPANEVRSPWGGVLVVVLFLIGAVFLLVQLDKSNKINLPLLWPEPTATLTPTPLPLPTETPEPEPVLPSETIVRVLDYGRLMVPIPSMHIEDPAGAIIMYVPTSSSYYVAIGALDELAQSLVEPGDLWVYYFDTANNGSLFYVFRCLVSDFETPIENRNCQSSQFRTLDLPYTALFDLGFVSSRD